MKTCMLTSKLGKILVSCSFYKNAYPCLTWRVSFSEINVWKSQDWSFLCYICFVSVIGEMCQNSGSTEKCRKKTA